ncbi:MAG: YraN family protein, partial [Bacteroidota bacterium]
MYRPHKIGDTGEKIAAHHLVKKGYHILEYNWRSGKAEIDLIAHQNGTLVFVEVKTRSNTKFGYPESAVSEQKINMVYKGATAYCRLVSHESEIRFDIISIVLNPKLEILHFEDAFFPGW